jgi:hypothetical protein
MTKTYPYLKYIPHFVVLRIVVLGPFVIAQETAEFISNSLDKFTHKLDKFLPSPYVEKNVEWHQLPKRNQEAIEYLAQKRNTTKERIMVQTVKY